MELFVEVDGEESTVFALGAPVGTGSKMFRSGEGIGVGTNDGIPLADGSWDGFSDGFNEGYQEGSKLGEPDGKGREGRGEGAKLSEGNKLTDGSREGATL